MILLAIVLLASCSFLPNAKVAASDRGNRADSTYQYARMSAFDRGTHAYDAKHYKRAFKYWQDAAAHGNVHALNDLGYLLYNGMGVKKNQVEAVWLWKTAAYSGHSEAQWHLGLAYWSGHGVESDKPTAYAWIRCSIENATANLGADDGDVEAKILASAKASLDELAGTMDAVQIAQGQQIFAVLIARYKGAPP